VRITPLVVNDITGEWVMAHNITRVTSNGAAGSRVYVRVDGFAGGGFSSYCYINSPLTAKQLLDRMREQVWP
jgi:hypothetical protein